MTHCFSRGHSPDLKLLSGLPTAKAPPQVPWRISFQSSLAYRLPFGRRTALSSSVKISQTSPFGKKHSHKGPGDGCLCVHLGRGHLQLGFTCSKRVMNPSIACTLECVGGLSWGDGPQFSLAAPGLHDPGLERLCSCWLSSSYAN